MSVNRRKSQNFYEAPEGAPTSAQIIEHAKETFGLKSVSSNRPETPLDVRRSIGSNIIPSRKVSLPPISTNVRQGNKAYSAASLSKGILLRSGSLHDLKLENGTIQSLDTRRISSGPTERTPPPATTDVSCNSPVKRGVHIPERGEGDGKEASPREALRSSDFESASDGNDEDSQLAIIGTRADLLQTDTFEIEVKPLLMKLDLASFPDAKKTCDQLFDILENLGWFRRKTKCRTEILKILFNALNANTDPEYLLKITRMILKFSVNGSNLLNILKVIYTLSRMESNDQRFLDNKILELLLGLCNTLPLTANHSMVLLVGTLKALTNSSLLKPHLLEFEELEIMGRLLKRLLAHKKVSPEIFLEITGCFRNIIDDTEAAKRLIGCVMSDLLTLTTKCSENSDVMLNISRILSKLSAYEECCADLSDPGICSTCLMLINAYFSSPEILVRLLFVLSNLCSLHEEMRRQLIDENACQIVTGILDSYLTVLDDVVVEINDRDERKLDVTVKLIAFAANWSIEKNAATVLASSPKFTSGLLTILESSERFDNDLSVELVQHTATVLNNLTFHANEIYQTVGTDVDIATALLHLMRADRQDWMLEACRAFGNLTRNLQVRNRLSEFHFVEMLVAALDSSTSELVYNVCGVLINLLLDKDNRVLFVNQDGAHKLCEVLEDYIGVNWKLATLACQVLSNCTTDTQLNPDTVGRLVNLFSFATDEEWAISNSEDSTLEDWYTDFCPVSQRLFKRLLAQQREDQQNSSSGQELSSSLLEPLSGNLEDIL